MAKNDDLHEMAKKLYSMKSKGQKPKRTEANAAPSKEPKSKPPTEPAKKQVAKKKPLPSADSDLIDEPVAQKPRLREYSAPKETAEELRDGFQFDRAQAMKGGDAKLDGKKMPGVSKQHAELLDEHVVDPYVEKVSESVRDKSPSKAMATRQRQLIAEYGEGGANINPKMPKAKGAFSALESDIPKGGKKIAMEAAEHLAPTATSKAEMAMIKSPVKRFVEKHLGSAVGASLLGATLAGPVGFGLQGLMEALDAEDSNPNSHDRAAEHVSSREAMNAGVAPRGRLQNELPSATKKPRIRTDAVVDYGEDGPSDQQKMEDEYADYMRKQPR